MSSGQWRAGRWAVGSGAVDAVAQWARWMQWRNGAVGD